MELKKSISSKTINRAPVLAIACVELAMSDVYKGLKHFDSFGASEIQLRLIEYMQVLIEDEWLSLAEDRLNDRAGVLLWEIGSSALLLEAPIPQNSTKMSPKATPVSSAAMPKQSRLPYSYPNVI